MFSAAAGAMSGLASSALNHASNFLGSSVGQSLVSGGAIFGGDFGSGLLGHYFGKKSSKYNAQKQREMANYMMNLQKKYNEWLIPFQNSSNLEYQLRYANGRPQAEVSGLRAAGLNPILAASGGFHSGSMSGSTSSSIPSSPSSQYVPSTGKGSRYFDPLALKQFNLLDEQIKSLKLDNELKSDNTLTQKAVNEVKRLKAEAESDILKPEYKGGLDGLGKRVEIYVKSEGFKALQKAIRDDYDLRSEKYMRETVDAVMRYGVDVLKLLPAFRQKQIMETISETFKQGNKTTTYTTHGPKM